MIIGTHGHGHVNPTLPAWQSSLRSGTRSPRPHGGCASGSLRWRRGTKWTWTRASGPSPPRMKAKRDHRVPLTMLDEGNREGLEVAIGPSLLSRRVTREVDHLVAVHDCPSRQT